MTGGMGVKRVLCNLAVLFAVIAAAVLIAFALRDVFVRVESSESASGGAKKPLPTLIIDAGHGGLDGGAVSDSGVRESEINLDIAKKLDLLMGFLGARTVMTRDSEDIIYSESSNSIRKKKIEDMKCRVNLVNAMENAVLISIHQDKYPSGGPSGAQTLYARTDGSKALAENMQRVLISALNPGNCRTAAPIPGSIYLMNNVTCPALLIECGFLSNQEEEALLATPEYRLKIAATIAAGYLSFEKEE